jgi:hypothetical protein
MIDLEAEGKSLHSGASHCANLLLSSLETI